MFAGKLAAVFAARFYPCRDGLEACTKLPRFDWSRSAGKFSLRRNIVKRPISVISRFSGAGGRGDDMVLCESCCCDDVMWVLGGGLGKLKDDCDKPSASPLKGRELLDFPRKGQSVLKPSVSSRPNVTRFRPPWGRALRGRRGHERFARTLQALPGQWAPDPKTARAFPAQP